MSQRNGRKLGETVMAENKEIFTVMMHMGKGARWRRPSEEGLAYSLDIGDGLTIFIKDRSQALDIVNAALGIYYDIVYYDIVDTEEES
jgi:hypothetical protein